MSLFLAGAVFGVVQVRLFVAGAVLREVLVSLFVAGAVLGEGQVSLFVAGAAPGEGLNVRLGAKRCILQEKMLLGTSKSNLTCEAGCGLRFCGRIMVGYGRIWSDYGRIMVGSVPHWKWRFSCSPQISARCWVVVLRGRRSIWWVWRVTLVAPRIVNEVSYVTRMNHACYFSWQVQYLVKF